MEQPFGISLFYTLLLWGCICFPPLKGNNIAHGYSLNDNQQSSSQSHSGALLNTDEEDKTQALRHQIFSSLQREPVHYENRQDVASFGEEMVQHKSDPGRAQKENLVASSAPSAQKYKHSMSYNQHPFVLLLTEHMPKNTVEGISFPTVKYVRHFIEVMKSSFLTPGSDLGRHFQTAQDVMKSELTSGVENGESSTSSDHVTEGSAQDDSSKNEVWSEPLNAEFEQNEPTANHQPRKTLSFPDPVDSTANLISLSVHDDQGYGLYPRNNSAATKHVSSNYVSLADGGISEENPDLHINVPYVQNQVAQSISYKLPEHATSGGDFSYSSQVTAPPVERPIDPSHASDLDIQQPTHLFHSGVSYTRNQEPPHGSEFGEDQKAKLYRVTPTDLLFPRDPPTLNSYGKSFYVRAPRNNLYIPKNLPIRRERPAQSVPMYQVTAGKQTNDIKNTPTIHLPASTASTSGHAGAEQSGPHDPQQQLLSEKQPVRSNHVLIVNPSSSTHDSVINDGYFRNHHAKHEEMPDLSKVNQVSSFQEPQQKDDKSPFSTSSSFDLTSSVISSQDSSVHGSPDSHVNLAQTSKPKNAFSKLFGSEVMSRNFEISNIISDRFPLIVSHSVKNPFVSPSTQQKQGISLSDIFVSATKPGRLHNFIQPIKIQRRPVKVNKGPSTMAHQHLKPLFASKVPVSTFSSTFWRHDGSTKRFPPQRRPNISPQFVNTYATKSRSSYVRDKVSESKTSFTPYWHVEGNTTKDQWKTAPGKQEA